MSDRYAVTVDTEFRASHRLDPEGAPTAEHEHRWRVSVTASSAQLDRIAIVVDFRKLRQQTDDLLAPLRGRLLEETAELSPTGTSPLAVAEWLLYALQAQISEGDAYAITSVTVGCDPRIDFRVSASAD